MSAAASAAGPVRVLSVASEMYPLIKTGGLADVVGALPPALAAEGVEMRTLLPGYPAVMAAAGPAEPVHTMADFFGGAARILASAGLFILDAPHLYARPGGPYTAPDGRDWPDNPLRFAALAYAGALIGGGAVPGFVPDIVHAHDWQAGLTAAYLHFSGARGPATVMTVHNLAFQGQVPASLLGELRLPPRAYTVDGVEYYGSIGMLKAGVALSGRITTVSPTYAGEITTEAGGMGMGGLLRARSAVLSGILNGIDTQAWNPGTDRHLPACYTAADLPARAANKTALQARLGLEQAPHVLLYGVISRLSHQKGMDFVLAALPALLAQGAQLAVLGAGEPELASAFARAEIDHPGRIALVAAMDESMAHRMQAAADAILVPSRFEPCGLTQLCALRYGAVPVVSRVGGLADTVIDANEAALEAEVATGIMLPAASPEGLRDGLRRAELLWRDQSAWRAMQRAGMATESGWARPARRYAALYRSLMEHPGRD